MVRVFMTPSEEQEQTAVVRWLRRNNVLFTHPPNGLIKSKVTGARAKRMGVSAGVPDLLIFTPPPRRAQACGVAIEMKRRRGRRVVSLHQQKWLRGLEEVGWLTYVVDGASEGIRLLKELGYYIGEGSEGARGPSISDAD
ncbi:MAG: hypothetical protein CMJ20_06830 [Phycisphaeraceae bacterium]|nr:hypothetical protein [Phycisphaeraceae bacterium]